MKQQQDMKYTLISDKALAASTHNSTSLPVDAKTKSGVPLQSTAIYAPFKAFSTEEPGTLAMFCRVKAKTWGVFLLSIAEM